MQIITPLMRVPDRASAESVCNTMLGAPSLPLFRAAADGRLALLTIPAPDVRWPARAVGKLHVPVVVIVGDDPGPGLSRGPVAWKASERLRRWCRWSIVHGAAGEADHYRAVIDVAGSLRRVVIVETSSKHALAWRRFLGPEGLTIMPPPDQHHPTPAVLQ